MRQPAGLFSNINVEKDQLQRSFISSFYLCRVVSNVIPTSRPSSSLQPGIWGSRHHHAAFGARTVRTLVNHLVQRLTLTIVRGNRFSETSFSGQFVVYTNLRR